jgi:hypothetical protein
MYARYQKQRGTHLTAESAQRAILDFTDNDDSDKKERRVAVVLCFRSSSIGGGELLAVVVAVEATAGQEFMVGAGFDDAAGRENHEAAGVNDR